MAVALREGSLKFTVLKGEFLDRPGHSYETADERFDFRGLERFDNGANVGTPVFEPKIQRIARRNDNG